MNIEEAQKLPIRIFNQNAQSFEEINSDSQNELWDDSDLITAYDKAIGLAKDKIINGVNVKEGTSSETKVHKKKKNNKNTSYIKNEKWQVGAFCKAKWKEDGLYYEAIILSMTSNDQCVVKFLGYANEDEVSLKSLKPSKGNTARKKQIKDSESFQKYAFKAASENIEEDNEEENEEENSFSSSEEYLSTPAPPKMSLSLPTDHREALYSMLMSWYMTGYHTGYYDGLRNSKKKRPKKNE